MSLIISPAHICWEIHILRYLLRYPLNWQLTTKLNFHKEKCALMVIRAAEFHPNEKGKHRHPSHPTEKQPILEPMDFNSYFPVGDMINSLDVISKVCSTWAALRLICPPLSGAEIQENCQLMPSLSVLQYFHWQKYACHKLQRELSIHHERCGWQGPWWQPMGSLNQRLFSQNVPPYPQRPKRTTVAYLVASLDKFLGSKRQLQEKTNLKWQLLWSGTLVHLNKANINRPPAALRNIPEFCLQSGLLLLLCTWRSGSGTPSHFTEHSYPRDQLPACLQSASH